MRKVGLMMFVTLAMLGLSILLQGAMADEINLPAAKTGFVYSVSENEVSDVYATEVLNFKDFTLDAGYYRDEKSGQDTGILALAYKIGGLSRFGINTPITKFVDLSVGYYAGMGRIRTSNEFQHGVYLSLAKFAF